MCGERGIHLIKRKDANLTTKMFLLLLKAVITGSVIFVFLYFAGGHVLKNYFYESDYIYNAEKPYIRELQSYVKKNHVASDDSEQLKEWAAKKKITYFSVSRKRKILYDSFYMGTIFFEPEKNDILGNIWYFLQPVTFTDVVADVYIYMNYESKLNFLFMLSIITISFGICFAVFIFGIRKEVRYIQKLSRGVELIEGGEWKTEFEIREKDELGNLAYGLDKMRRTLIIKEDNEQKMKESQNSLVLAMAHDLRTPLTSLITFLEIALKKSKDIENTECLKKCYKKADQIRELTDQLFDFFLIQKKEKVELEPSANAEYAIGEYLSEFCEFVELDGYQVIAGNMKWSEAKVRVYSKYVGRIMDNLVSNIKKYADKDYPIILEVKNDKNTIQIVFENQKNTKKEYVEGTGIGIQNIKNMMEQMEGKSEIINNENTYAIVLSFPIYIE